MKFKKLMALGLSLSMTMGLAACSGGQTTQSAAPSSSGGEGGGDAQGMKIAIVTSPNTVDDGSFNENNYNGILNFIESRGNIDTVTPVQEPTGDPSAAAQTVSDIVADYDVLVCTGFQFAGIATVAEENPEKKFILVDSFPSDAEGNEVEVENVYAMQFAEQESGFFAGVAAALETKTGKVAVVNGVAYPSNVNYQYGFESGVNYARKNQAPPAEVVQLPSYAGTDVTGANVGGNYSGNFSDEATGKVIGNALIQQGVDVIFVAAGASGNGVFTAAKESNGAAMVIGCDVDQYDDGANGDSNIILTSVLKNMAVNVERQLNAIVDGSFKGGNYTLYADTDSTGYVSEEGRQQMSADTISMLDELYPKVKDGTIKPASNFNGYTPDDFPGL